jgi:hypothetical protein
VSSHRQQERSTFEQGIFQAEVKMTRVSRRKTLSHSEIESFLNDIDDALDLPAPPNAVDKEKIASVTQLYVPPAPVASPPPTKVVDPLRAEVQSIREFCKVSHCRTLAPLAITLTLILAVDCRLHLQRIVAGFRWSQREICAK